MASPVSTAVKYFRNDLPSAPAVNGLAGSGVSALRAFLVTGFGLRSVTSAVIQEGYVRLTLPSEPLQTNMLYTVIEVAGATPAGLNGEQRVMFASATELRFPTTLPDGPVTGSITIKTASAGWEELFIGTVTNKAAFRRTNPLATAYTLLVNDTLGNNIGVRGVLDATSVTDGSAPFPDTANPTYWQKSTVATAGAISWDAWADSRGFYFSPFTLSSATGSYPLSRVASMYFFGDPLSSKPVDPYGCLLFAKTNANAANEPPSGTATYYSSQSGGSPLWARSWTGLGTPKTAYTTPEGSTVTGNSGADPTRGVFPNPFDGILYTMRIIVTEGGATSINSICRGVMPGILHIPHSGVATYLQPRGEPVVLQNSDVALPIGVGNTGTDIPASAIALMTFLNGWR